MFDLFARSENFPNYDGFYQSEPNKELISTYYKPPSTRFNVIDPCKRWSSPRRLPELDRRILQRMLYKRQEERQQREHAHLARIHWAEEQRALREIHQKRGEHLSSSVRASQAIDRQRLAQRLDALHVHDAFLRKQHHFEQQAKSTTWANRMQWARDQRAAGIAERKRMQQQRLIEAADRREDQALHAERLAQEDFALRDQRISRAQCMRTTRNEMYRQRLQADNRAEMRRNAERQAEADAEHRLHVDALKKDISHRDRRTEWFVRQRERGVRASRAQAQWTGDLREFVRRSTSPTELDRFAEQINAFGY